MNKYLPVLCLSLMMMSSGCLNAAELDLYQGEDIIPVQTYRPFELQDNNNSIFNSSSLDGDVVVFGFIYVNCPDVCPTTTSDMKWIKSQLSVNERLNVSFISISVDPWRDGSVALTNYMEEYNVSWPHLTTTVETEENLSLLENVWTDFSIGVVLTEANSSTSIGRGHTVYYDILHTNGLVLVDEFGYQRVRWTHDHWDSKGILSDIRSMIN